MITFKTFLAEASLVHLDELEPEQYKWVKAFLAESDDRPLYRGTDNLGKYPTLVNRPVGRRPLHTDDTVHRGFDDLLLHEVGFRGRSGAFFTSGSERVAKIYGKPYYIIPCTKYKYTWFARKGGRRADSALGDSGDITMHVLGGLKDLARDGEHGDLDQVLNNDDLVQLCLKQAMLDLKLTLRTDELAYAIKEEAEIMLHCEQAIMVPATEGYEYVLDHFVGKP